MFLGLEISNIQLVNSTCRDAENNTDYSLRLFFFPCFLESIRRSTGIGDGCILIDIPHEGLLPDHPVDSQVLLLSPLSTKLASHEKTALEPKVVVVKLTLPFIGLTISASPQSITTKQNG